MISTDTLGDAIPEVKAVVNAAETELVDVILAEYYPFKWVAKLVNINRNREAASDPDDPSNGNESNVEKWILIAFCSICILAMVVCIIVLIIYKVRKNQHQRDIDEESDSDLIHPINPTQPSSRQRQPR